MNADNNLMELIGSIETNFKAVHGSVLYYNVAVEIAGKKRSLVIPNIIRN